MKLYKLLAIAILGICTCFVLIGCGGDTGNKFKGTYESESTHYYDKLVVNESGFFTIDSYEKGKQYARMTGIVDDSGHYSNAVITYTDETYYDKVYGLFVMSSDVNRDVRVSINHNGHQFSNYWYYRVSKSKKSAQNNTKLRADNESSLGVFKED